MREQIDFLVLAPLKVEIDALVKNIKKAGGVLNKKSLRTATGCYSFTLNELNIVVIQLVGQGCLQSSFQTMNLLDEFDPEFTISFGIAGSLLSNEVNLGDVVIGKTVYYYEPAKETTDENVRLSGNESHSHPNGVTLSQHIAYLCHAPQIKLKQKNIKVHNNELIASGEKLIADYYGISRQLILKIQRKIACVEMEAAGVAAAVQNHHQYYERNKFIAVKGISDYADKNKNTGTLRKEEQGTDEKNTVVIAKKKKSIDEKDWQKKAAGNAAIVLIELIQNMSREAQTYQSNHLRIESVKQFAATFDKWIIKFGKEICECKIDYDLLKRAAFYSGLTAKHHHFERKVPIYYHWRQLNKEGLHLVDYLQLILLHRLSKASSVEPIALITYDETKFDLDQLKIISSQVKEILDSEPIYSSEIHKQYNEYTTYCAKNGYDGSENENIASFSHARSDIGKHALFRLLPYVAYKSRHLGACIVLCWHEHRKIYDELLMKILPLQPIILEVGTINVGGEAAKFGSCSTELIVNPSSNYKEFYDWVKDQTDKNKNEVKQYINCLMDDDLQTGNNDELLRLVEILNCHT